MGKIAALVPRKLASMQQKSFATRRTSIGQQPVRLEPSGSTFGFASQLQNTSGVEEHRVLSRFVGGL
jgi:hypothetical protein